ncbi:hypothetical protein bcere0021_53600 [Bacillus cereus Rock3-42]|nr:hypothetical protein bcere0021_53600 [Bacillus cereus Rock3-42]
MDENRRDIMDYYDEWQREPTTDIKWYRNIIQKIGKGNLISIVFLVFLVGITCYFYKLDNNAYINLNTKLNGWESDLRGASIKVESNNYGFGLDKKPAIFKNMVPMYIQVNDEKILVQKDSLEIHTQLFRSDIPMRMDTPWPIATGKLSIIPVRSSISAFGEGKGYLIDMNLDKIYEQATTKNTRVMLRHAGDSSVKLELLSSNDKSGYGSRVYINGENKKIKGNTVILTPYEKVEKNKSITFVVSNFTSVGFDHLTGIEGSKISNFEVESINSSLSVNTDQGAILNIIKSATPQKIDVPKTQVSGKGDMYFTLKFDDKSFISEITGLATDMTIAGKSVFPNIWQWSKDNAITILTTILTAAITAFLGRESLYSKKK